MAEYIEKHDGYWWSNIETEEELVSYLDDKFLRDYNIDKSEREYVYYYFSSEPISVDQHIKGIPCSSSFFNEISNVVAKKKIPDVTAVIRGAGMKIDNELDEIISTSKNFTQFKKKLKGWGNKWLEDGASQLPQ